MARHVRVYNSSTVQLLALQVFVTATARTLALATALVLPSSVMLLVDTAEGKDALAARLDKYIFPADKVTVGAPACLGCVSRRSLRPCSGAAVTTEGFCNGRAPHGCLSRDNPFHFTAGRTCTCLHPSRHM
jgi:folate-binding Fe-S cluster repair protein YgfZ